MKTPKKLLSFLTAVTMSLYALPMTAWTEEITEDDQAFAGSSYSEGTNSEEVNSEEIISDEANTDSSGTAETTGTETDVAPVGAVTDVTKEKSSEDANNDYSTAPLSLLPLNTVYGYVWLDRSDEDAYGDNPYSFTIREAVNNFDTDPETPVSAAINDGDRLWYSPYGNSDDRYVEVGWDDPITPYSVSYDPERNVMSAVVKFIKGDGDQLNINNVYYYMYIYFDTSMIFNSEISSIKDAEMKVYNSDKEQMEIYNEESGEGLTRAGKTAYKYFINRASVICGDPNNYMPYFKLVLPEEYSSKNVSVYDGWVYTEENLKTALDITSKVIEGVNDKEMCDLPTYGYYNSSSNYYEYYYKRVTFAIDTEDGKIIQPAEYRVTVSRNNVVFDYRAADDNELSGYYYHSYNYMYLYSDKAAKNMVGYYNVHTAKDFSDLEPAKIYANYYYYTEDGVEHLANSKVKSAYIGNYKTETAAKQKKAEDIKTKLFDDKNYPVDFSKWTDMGTLYMQDGTAVKGKKLEVTVFDENDIPYHGLYTFVIAPEIVPQDASTQSTDTYFNASFPYKKAGSNWYADANVGTKDSYFLNGYQTIFILDGKNPVTETTIYPTFSTGKNARIYVGTDVAKESATTPRQTSGQSPIVFESGKAIQYSAASESGTHLKNYWVTYVTQYQGGAKLFVNATNVADHYNKEKNIPQREVLLGESEPYHDILIANIGDDTLTGIKVELSADTKGVKLDPYWTIVENGVNELGAFTTTSSSMKNIAKIRLVPESEDFNGEISGTLTIRADGQTPVQIDLTGTVGTPEIVTTELIDGVQYVPYSCVIQTTNMYNDDAVKFRLYSGKLPEGLELLENGEIYGIPMEFGEDFEFTVQMEATVKTKFGTTRTYTLTQKYTLVVKDNTDDNVEAVNVDPQGYELLKEGPHNVTIYYNGFNADQTPRVDRMEIDSELFWSKGELGDFVEFYIDGKSLARGADYQAVSGSTIITVLAQTFSHIGMTDNKTPHTLAAEFRLGGTGTGAGVKELKRSARNVYVTYVPISNTTGGDSSGNGGTGNSGSGSSGSKTPPLANNDKAPAKSDSSGGSSGNDPDTSSSDNSSNTATVTMSFVKADGTPAAGLALELHSEPKYATTDSSGMAKFEGVEFGRHTLYVTDPETGNTITKTFTLVAGKNAGINGNVITAVPGETMKLEIAFDGAEPKFLSAEDVSSAAGIIGDNELLWNGLSQNGISAGTAIIILLSLTGIYIVIAEIRKKNKV